MDTPSDSRNQGEGKRKCAENWIRDKRFGLDKRVTFYYYYFFDRASIPPHYPRSKIVIYV